MRTKRRLDGDEVVYRGKREYRHRGCAVERISDAADDIPVFHEARPWVYSDKTCGKCGKPIAFLEGP